MNKPIGASMNHERYESARKLVEGWSVWHDHKQLVISVIDRAVRLEREVERIFDQSESTRLREALSKIIDVLTDDTSINAQRINNIIIEAFSSSHREDGWIPADKTPAAGQYLVSDGNQVSFGWWMEGSDDRRWYAADAAPFLSEDITHYRPIPVPPISIITVER